MRCTSDPVITVCVFLFLYFFFLFFVYAAIEIFSMNKVDYYLDG